MCRGFPPESFDYVLLDAPCTGLGLRPRLLHRQTIGQLRSAAHYQRKLLDVAVALLKPGGEMVYSTCSINPGARPWTADRPRGSCRRLENGGPDISE